MDRKLLDYLPPVLREVLELQAVNAANEPEISLAWDALELVLANQFLDTANGHGLSGWERELNIRPKDTDAMEVRRARIKAKWNLELPYTLPWLKNWLTSICGPTGHEVSVSGYTIDLRLDYSVLPNADSLAAEIRELLLTVRPENMRVQVSAVLRSRGTLSHGACIRSGLRMTVLPYKVERQYSTARLEQDAAGRIGIQMTVHMEEEE